MPTQPSRSPVHSFDPPVWTVLDLLLERDPEHYTVGELARKTGGAAPAAEALGFLEAAGLILQTGELVRLTPASQARR